PPETCPLSLHDALPICGARTERPFHRERRFRRNRSAGRAGLRPHADQSPPGQHPAEDLLHCLLSSSTWLVLLAVCVPLASLFCRSEEHTSELQSRENLV